MLILLHTNIQKYLNCYLMKHRNLLNDANDKLDERELEFYYEDLNLIISFCFCTIIEFILWKLVSSSMALGLSLSFFLSLSLSFFLSFYLSLSPFTRLKYSPDGIFFLFLICYFSFNDIAPYRQTAGNRGQASN